MDKINLLSKIIDEEQSIADKEWEKTQTSYKLNKMAFEKEKQKWEKTPLILRALTFKWSFPTFDKYLNKSPSSGFFDTYFNDKLHRSVYNKVDFLKNDYERLLNLMQLINYGIALGAKEVAISADICAILNRNEAIRHADRYVEKGTRDAFMKEFMEEHSG